MANPRKDSFEETEIFKFCKLVAEITRFSDNILRKNTNLTYSQFLVLMAIDCKCLEQGSGKKSYNCINTQKQIAESLSETQAALSRQIENLRQKGYLTREENRVNRREHVIRITQQGVNELEKAYKVMKIVNSNFFNPISRAEHSLLKKCLIKLVDNLKDD
jgi:DNA-binding MarR family transcriptional regulator